MEQSEHPPSPRLRGIVLRSFSEGGHKLSTRTYPSPLDIFKNNKRMNITKVRGQIQPNNLANISESKLWLHLR